MILLKGHHKNVCHLAIICSSSQDLTWCSFCFFISSSNSLRFISSSLFWRSFCKSIFFWGTSIFWKQFDPTVSCQGQSCGHHCFSGLFVFDIWQKIFKEYCQSFFINNKKKNPYNITVFSYESLCNCPNYQCILFYCLLIYLSVYHDKYETIDDIIQRDAEMREEWLKII